MSEQAPQFESQAIDTDALLQANRAARRDLEAQQKQNAFDNLQEGWVGDQGLENKSDKELAAQAHTVISYRKYAKEGPQNDQEVWNVRSDHFENSGGERIENKGANELMADYARAAAYDDRTLKEDVLGEIHRRASDKNGQEQKDYLNAYDKRFNGILGKLKDAEGDKNKVESLLKSYDAKAQEASKARKARDASKQIEVQPKPKGSKHVEAKLPATDLTGESFGAPTGESEGTSRKADVTGDTFKAPKPSDSETPARRPKPGKKTVDSESNAPMDNASETPLDRPEVDEIESDDPEERFHTFVESLNDTERDAVTKIADFIKTVENGDGFRTKRQYAALGIEDSLSFDKYLATLNHLTDMGILRTNPHYVHDDNETPKAYWKTGMAEPTSESNPENGDAEPVSEPIEPAIPGLEEGQPADEQADEDDEPTQDPGDETSGKKSRKARKEARKAKRSEERSRKIGGGLLQRFRDAGNYLPDNYGEDDYVQPSLSSRVRNFGSPSETSLVAGARSLARDEAIHTEAASYRAQLEADATTKLLDRNNPDSGELNDKAYAKRLDKLVKAHMNEWDPTTVEFDSEAYAPSYGQTHEQIQQSGETKAKRKVGRLALFAQNRSDARAERERKEEEARERRRAENGMNSESDLHDDLVDIGS